MKHSILSSLNTWDAKLFSMIYHMSGRKKVDWFLYHLSRLGDGYVYVLLGLLVLIFDFEVGRKLFPAGLIAFVIDMSVYYYLKHKIRRVRPFEFNTNIKSLIRPPDKFSFPSGHAAGAFLVAVIMGQFYPLLSMSYYLLASLVGFSRVYNGVHFPSDVVAGMVIGFTSGKIGLVIIL